jgi:hypothetical protein
MVRVNAMSFDGGNSLHKPQGSAMTTYSPEEQWHAYMAAFGATESDERDRLLQQSVSDDVIFTNPGGSGKTRTDLSAHIVDFQTKMPTMYFRTDKVHLSQGELLAIWSMYKSDHTKVATGYNFVRLDEDGRFNYMAGFF